MTSSSKRMLTHVSVTLSPPGWSEISVDRLIVKHFCGPSPDCEERQLASDEEWGVLKTTAITWDGWDETAHKVLPRHCWGLRELEVQHGDVLVTKAGPRDRVGVVVHVTTYPKRLIVSGKMIGLRLRASEVLPQVLVGVLSLREAQDFIHARTTGMAESQVNFANTVLLQTAVRIPDLAEQSRIAAVLDAVDGVIAKTGTVMAKLRQVRAGLLHDLLTRGLDEHSQLRDPITHPQCFQDSLLGQLPREWNLRCLGDVLQSPPRNGYSPREGQAFGGSYLLGLGCLTSEGFAPLQLKNAPTSDPQLAPFLLRDGDLLISRSNTRDLVGLPGIFRNVSYPCYYPDLMMRLTPKAGLITEFLELLLRHSRSRAMLVATASGTSGSMVKITGTGVMETPIAYPDHDEQQRILTALTPFDEELKILYAEDLKLKALKSGLMSDLLTGRVRVPEGVVVAP